MSDDLLNLDLGSKVGFEVTLHPLVPLQILDLYYRKHGNLNPLSSRAHQRNSRVIDAESCRIVDGYRLHKQDPYY